LREEKGGGIAGVGESLAIAGKKIFAGRGGVCVKKHPSGKKGEGGKKKAPTMFGKTLLTRKRAISFL